MGFKEGVHRGQFSPWQVALRGRVRVEIRDTGTTQSVGRSLRCTKEMEDGLEE